MEKQVDLLRLEPDRVHEIKKNIPNMEMFLEHANDMASLCSEEDPIAVFRFDICHFKQVNDTYGFEVGDNVIVACYEIIRSNVEKHFGRAAFGRAHGDEFIVFAGAGLEETEHAAQAIVEDMKRFDFSTCGCQKDMGCYIGGLISQQKTNLHIRTMIESSIEVIHQARNQGRNSVVIQSC